MNAPLMLYRFKSDFDKLLFALGYVRYLKARIKSLEFEIGVLKSELAEKRYKDGTDEIERLKQVVANNMATLQKQRAGHEERKKKYRKLALSYQQIIRRQQTEIMNLKNQIK
jgi:hypothetical protein